MMASGLASGGVSAAKSFINSLTSPILTVLKHSHAAVAIDTGHRPLATNPDIAKSVWTTGLVRTLNGDELAHDTLPKVETIPGRIQLGIGSRNEVNRIRDTKNATHVETRVFLCGGRQSINTNDLGSNLVAARTNNDVGRVAELVQVNVVPVRSRSIAN